MQVIATAGHVDHGKSTLVRALTGMEPDRWAEERRRGMTIDLGFGWCALPGGAQVAFVDVPGHARFVANMLAGVGPVPAVLFVVAADEGWRQQSAEHLSALDAFGVRHGLLAVTRSDLADPCPATADALDRLAATSLGRVPAVAVSAATGAGLAELRTALAALVTRLPPADVRGDVRLWIDRAFTVRGAGTVVTGTLGAGALRVGDRLQLGHRAVSVRGLQSLGEPREQVPAVARVAVNVRGLDLADVRRGHALVTPDAWAPTDTLDVRLVEELPAEVLAHVGSAAVPARVRPLGWDVARVRLADALPLRPGDRLLLRDPSRHDVLAGATVLDPLPPPLRRRGAAAARGADLATAEPDDAAGYLRRRRVVRRSDLRAAGLPVPADALVAGEWVLDSAPVPEWVAALSRAVDARDPLDPGLPPEAARHVLGLPDPTLVEVVVAASGGRLALAAGRVTRPGARPTLPPAAQAAVAGVRGRLAEAPFAAPEAPELAARGLTPALLAAAVRAGLLARVGDVVLLPDWAEEALRRLRALPQPFTASEARGALGTSRRVAIPVLEALDAAGRTRRVDAARRVVRDVR
jgi:selenocysteine-specific elongation factor